MKRSQLRVTIHLGVPGHRVVWSTGSEGGTTALVASAPIVDLPDPMGDVRADVHLRDRFNQQRFGRHLWAALCPPPEAHGHAEITLVSDDIDVLALPWQLASDTLGWLDSRDSTIRACWPEQPTTREPRVMGSSPHVLVGRPDPYHDGVRQWQQVLDAAGGGRVDLVDPAKSLPVDLDLLFLPVQGTSPTAYA